MSPLTQDDLKHAPTIGEPATVEGLTVLVQIRCRCGTQVSIALVNGQPACCETCFSVYHLARVAWRSGAHTPHVEITATPGVIPKGVTS